MSQLWFFYKQYHQSIDIEDRDEVTAGNERYHTVTIQAFPIEPKLTFVKSADGIRVKVYQEDKLIGTLTNDNQLTVRCGNEDIHITYVSRVYQETRYYIGKQTIIDFPDKDQKHFSMICHQGKWVIQPETTSVYLNGRQLTDRFVMKVGDTLFCSDYFLYLENEDVFAVKSKDDFKISLPPMKKPTTVMKRKYPHFRRTPRMIYDLPDDKVDFSFPSEERDHNQRGLWLIIAPPLMMLIVMGVVAMVRPRGIFILISITMFTTTLVTSTFQYFREKKRQREQNEKRIRLYTKYLEDKREELQKVAAKQREVLYFHFPSFERIKYLTGEISDRIWERTLMSHDFLHFRVGRASIPASYKMSTQRGDTANQEIDDLYEKSLELVNYYDKVKNAPLVINLADGAMGMIGKETIVKKEIQQIVGQLSFSQSYHDVRMVAIFDEAEYESWQWMKWLPHFQLPHVYAKGFIYNEQTRDQLLTSIYEIIKERELDEEREKKLFTPHFVFIVTNRQLISEHAILEYLEGEHHHLGISIIFAADSKESLTDNIHTLVRYIDETQGDILIQQQKAAHIPFKLDDHQHENNERFARTLMSLDHQLGMSHSIPDMVTFMEMFATESAENIGIREKWTENQSSKSLAVPVGLKGKDDFVYLNLHEKAHGPHGLLAGTTGSGKSEFLQTYILSLAVHFHPHEVAFLLIDYKGGGMAQPFKNMPHLLGTITNIEGSENFSKRALASIKSELKRRQRLFDQYEVNHINDYTDLYKEGEAELPLPHLFLISDEFAELKSEEPDFIRELVSAARIGRSLGVHLILATQKPGGIIDEQIWSNSRFKVALKVQDESDSKEILKNGDAAKITVTGRGYLQVGNNEIYELFQSAWSGAPYTKEAIGAEDEIALVTDLGLVPLSEVSTEDRGRKKDKKTEIDAVVEEIITVQHDMNIQKLSSPWLPPLPERATAPQMDVRKPHHHYIGMIDEPEKQSQTPYSYEAMEDGNIGVFGSAGYGKSMTLLTFLLSFAEHYSPEEYQFYIFDFGNGALLPLQQLPHTGDYFRSDDTRKIEKFLSFIGQVMDERKELFRQQEVSNIQMYNTVGQEKLPLIFLTIDNYDLVKEELTDYESRFTQIARDGQSLGIYTMLSATRSNAVRHALMSNLKTLVAHYFMDRMEKHNIVGRTEYETEAVPGRVYIKTEAAYLAQIYLPVEGETDVAVLENLKTKVQMLKEKYAGAKEPEAIPMLPRKLGLRNYYKNYRIDNSSSKLAIGLNEDTVQPVYIDWKRHNHCLIVGDAQKGKTNVLKLMIESMLEQSETKIGLFDSVDHALADYGDDEDIVYMESKEHVETWLQLVEQEFTKREEVYREALQERKAGQLEFPPYLLMVDGMANFQQSLDSTLQTKLSTVVKNYSHLGFRMVITGMATEFTKGFDVFTNEVKQIKHAILVMKKTDQSFIQLPYTRNEPEIKPGYGYYIEHGKATKIQIPLHDLERVTPV